MQLQIENIQFHRNGVTGAPFHTVIFQDPDERRMLGIVFEQDHHIAVFDFDKLGLDTVGPSISFRRGDFYEQQLRNAVALLLEMEG